MQSAAAQITGAIARCKALQRRVQALQRSVDGATAQNAKRYGGAECKTRVVGAGQYGAGQ